MTRIAATGAAAWLLSLLMSFQGLPAPDDWRSEALGQRVQGQLDLITAAAFVAEDEREGAFASLATTEFTCEAARPELSTGRVGAQGMWFGAARESTAEQLTFTGPSGLAESLALLFEPFDEPPRVHWKVIAVEPQGFGGHTRVLLEVEGESLASPVQQRATWDCEWTAQSEDAPLQLAALEITAFREASRAAALFQDVTESVLGANASFADQLLPSLETWRGRLDAALGVTRLGHQGLAVGDIDGDGLEDLYLCQPGGLPNRLYRRLPDGSAEDISAAAGVDFLDLSRGALLVDLDGDRDLDLALGLAAEVVLLQNDGSGKFSAQSSIAAPGATSLAAADFDLDGDLDLYVCSYVDPYDGDGAPLPYHDAENGAANLLLANRGEWKFEEVAAQVGLDANNTRFSFAAAWEDYDGDGDPDLYVANDFGRNNLYENTAGAFEDVAARAGVEDLSAGMGVAWGDADGDGTMDLYVSNMFSSAGQRVAYQRRFREGAAPEVLQQYQRHARGNSLFLNAGDKTFRDVSEESGVTRGRWSWGSIFSDMNGDGHLDLVVPNGFLTSERPDDL